MYKKKTPKHILCSFTEGFIESISQNWPNQLNLINYIILLCLYLENGMDSKFLH